MIPVSKLLHPINSLSSENQDMILVHTLYHGIYKLIVIILTG